MATYAVTEVFLSILFSNFLPFNCLWQVKQLELSWRNHALAHNSSVVCGCVAQSVWGLGGFDLRHDILRRNNVSVVAHQELRSR